MQSNRPSRSIRWPLGAALIAAVLMIAPDLWAQVNTSGLRGTVTTPDGAPLIGATVTLTHEPSGNEKGAITNASGAFAFTGLRVGGPYTLRVYAAGYKTREQGGIHLSVGKNERVQVALDLGEEVIEIVGEAPAPKNTSPRAVFDASDIGQLPSIGRDPKDLVRLTPGAYLDDSNNQAMSIGGANNRFNSVTIDGIRQDDDFGLNGNGYPTQRSPISLSAIEEIAVETSPFDVRYGRFLGGNVNIVTKSGTNEFHGAVLGAFANNDLVGTRSGPDELELDFLEARYGLSIGGPIVKDKVHFFVSFEGLNATTPVSVGPAGSGEANEVANVTADDVAEVQDIANSVYNFDAGVAAESLDELDLKFLAKVDWAISNDHRLSAKYQRTSGNLVRDSFFNDFNLPLTSNWYDLNETLNAYSVKVLSNWTDQLSSELEVSGKFVDNRQQPLANGFMEAEIGTDTNGTIVIGPDPFRHANQLDNNLLHIKGEASYLLGQHLLTAGAEFDQLSIFNLFVPFSNGVAEYDSIDDFRNMNPASIFYSNAVTNNPDDGAANWGYSILSAYLQDQYEITPEVTVQGGVRVEAYFAPGDVIGENLNFEARHGFSNTETVNGKAIPMPRLGVTYRPLRKLNLRGGVGLYSGGTPNVWISNNYSNDGQSIDSEFSNDPAVIGGFNGRDIPQEMQNALMAGDGNVDVLDPDFQLPSTWKAAAGFDYSLDLPGDQWKNFNFKVDYTFSKVRHGIKWEDLRRNFEGDGFENNTPIATGPDGRDIYDTDDSDGSAFNQRRGVDMLLTNTTEGHGQTLSVSVQKGFPFGLQLYAAYAWQNVKEVSPATSSRSVSNYGQAAVGLDPNNPELGTSNYERAHRVIGALQFSRALIADLLGSYNESWHTERKTPKLWSDTKTSIAMFFETRSGQPYSYTFGDSAGGNFLGQLFGEEREFARRNRMRFYVPDGSGNDVVLDGISDAEFDAYLERTGLDEYRGEIAPRNAFRSPWITRMDLRLAQEVPNPIEGQRARFIVDIQNLGNLLNSDWGRVEQVGFPYMVPVVDVNFEPATGRYIYSNLRGDPPERVNVLASVWRIQASLMYEF